MQSSTVSQTLTSPIRPKLSASQSATFSKDYPAETRLANLCDSGLVNQMAFQMEKPTGPASLTVLSCPFPTAKRTEAVFAGSLGDTPMDVIVCPVTIRMRDIKGQCITITAVKKHAKHPQHSHLRIRSRSRESSRRSRRCPGDLTRTRPPRSRDQRSQLRPMYHHPTQKFFHSLADIASQQAKRLMLHRSNLFAISQAHQIWMSSISGTNP